MRRPLRIAITIALLLAIALAVFWTHRDDIFQHIQDPEQPFQTYAPPTAPDYDDPSSWVSLPNLEADPFDHPGRADIFAVSPSVYRGGEHWVLPMDDERRRAKIERVIRPNYIDPYRSSGRVFAPHYRQASLYSFMTTREDAAYAQDFAYRDVARAFDVFIDNSPPERPIVLVGHGQGAAHIQRLVAERFQGELAPRLAAAYIIGHPFPVAALNDLAQPPCERAESYNCLVAFAAFMPIERSRPERMFVNGLVWLDGRYQSLEGRPALCINPLTWRRDESYAPADLHLGGVAAEGLDQTVRVAPLSKQTSAQCVDDRLQIDKPKARALRRPYIFGGKFRTLPSNIFYEDLRQNVESRVQALYAANILPRRATRLNDIAIEDVRESPVIVID